MEMVIGGKQFQLNTSAVSCIRYRAKYGDSVINHLGACSTRLDEERTLLRMCWIMIDPAQRPELPVLARLARKDKDFVLKATMAYTELFSHDPRLSKPEVTPDDAITFDEYEILANMATLGLDMALIYELPILHIDSIVRRIVRNNDPDAKSYRPLSQTEMTQLYPRRKKSG